jgi:16S rRNA (cytidine1402-2'-O)-methyltransferase
MMGESGKLYIVATPIGNLEDITLRAVRVLGEVDLIAAEDTRRTRILLQHYRIKTPVTSLYEQNEMAKSPALLARIKEGQCIACVTDAGTPAISDPGYQLVRSAIAEGIAVIPIPGVSALITALCVSGLPMDHFVFQGFLPDKHSKKRNVLQSLRDDHRTQIFYESPKRLLATLKDIREILGNRFLVVARELTKVHEEMVRGHVEDVLRTFADRSVKGEVTLIVAGSTAVEEPQSDENDVRERFDSLREKGQQSVRDIIDQIAAELSLPRKSVYHIVQRLRGSSS